MPNKRDDNKIVTSFGLHKDIYAALKSVAGRRGISMSRCILEAVAAHMGFTLDEADYPVGLDIGKPARRKKT